MKKSKLLISFCFLILLGLLSGCTKTYEVTFLDNNGNVIEVEKVKKGGTAKAPEISIPDGYEFKGWDHQITNIKSNIRVFPIFAIKSYVVNFLDYNGFTIRSQIINHGSNAEEPERPTLAGKTFKAWDKDFTNITSDLDITALYDNIYTVRFIDYDNKIIEIKSVELGKNVVAPTNPFREGYTFVGWDAVLTNITNNLDIHALYEINKYEIIFDSNGGSEVLKKENIEYNTTIEIDNPTKEGYDFLGWYLSNEQFAQNFTENTKVTSNLTLYARWHEKDLQHIIKDNEIIIIGYQGRKPFVEIPETIDGYPVKTINKGAFKGNESITEIKLPNNLKTIEDFAFSEMPNLSKITIPASVTLFGIKILENSNNVSEITLPGNQNLKTLFGYEENKIPQSLLKINIAEGSTYITDEALKDAVSVNELLIPCSVKNIGKYIISGTQIKVVDLSENNYMTSITEYAFYKAKALESISLPSSITSIGNYAFYEAIALTKIDLSNINCIGSYAFSETNSLNEVKFARNVDYIGEGAFSWAITLQSINLPDGITSIPDRLFEGNQALINVSIPDEVTSIGTSAFAKNASLKTITLPQELITIGDEAFFGAVSLTSIKIPNKVQTIGDNAFSGNVNLTTVTLSNSLIAIGDFAFYGVTKLNTITIPSTVTDLGNYTFLNATSLTQVDFTPGSLLTSIGISVFSHCSNLLTIEIPEGVTQIGAYAFSNNTKLVSALLPSTLLSIGNGAFKGTIKLSNIDIPQSVNLIGEEAFANCVYLINIKINNVTPFTINDNVFANTNNNLMIYVPELSIDSYKETWPNYATKIFKIIE